MALWLLRSHSWWVQVTEQPSARKQEQGNRNKRDLSQDCNYELKHLSLHDFVHLQWLRLSGQLSFSQVSLIDKHLPCITPTSLPFSLWSLSPVIFRNGPVVPCGARSFSFLVKVPRWTCLCLPYLCSLSIINIFYLITMIISEALLILRSERIITT